MPVPDKICFGPDTNGEGLSYGQVRALPEEEQFLALNRRFDSFFVKQVNELAKIENEKRLVYSPFPLFLMTCVGIETLGKILFTRAPGPGESEEDVQRLGFLKVCGGIHSGFPRPLNKVQKQEYDQLWGANEHNTKEAPELIPVSASFAVSRVCPCLVSGRERAQRKNRTGHDAGTPHREDAVAVSREAD